MKHAVFTILLALAAKAVAQQVRVTMQVIEVPHAELTKWTSKEKLTGRELHERAMKLAATGGAEIVDTSLLVVQSGQQAWLESICERIYPVEYDFDMPHSVPPAQEQDRKVRRDFRAYDKMSSGVFETRNTGATMEVEPTVGEGGQLVDLRFAFDVVDSMSLETWTEFRDQWGDASIRMPSFGTRRMVNAIPQRPGSFELCNVFTPKAGEVPAVATRQLLFVRCDVLPGPK